MLKNGRSDDLALLALTAEDGLLDLLCEDGLLSPEEARKERSPASLLALLRRIFGEAAPTVYPLQRAARVHELLSDAPLSLRAPPAAA